MTTKQAPLGAERSDLSVLEKLKRRKELDALGVIRKLTEDEVNEFLELTFWQRDILSTRLITALEMVEAKAHPSPNRIVGGAVNDFARELLAVLEGEK